MRDRDEWDLSPDPVAEALEYLVPHSAGALVREAFYGTDRFEDFVTRTGLTRSVVAHRLRHLVDIGIFEKVAYRRPGARARQAYALSAKGRDLTTSVVALAQWAQAWLPQPGGATVVIRHRDCGAEVHGSVACAEGHHDLGRADLVAEAGPGARRRRSSRGGPPTTPDT